MIEEITLTKEEIDYLAEFGIEAESGDFFSSYHGGMPKSLATKASRNAHPTFDYERITLSRKYDTPANRAAIANRRRELGLA